MHPFIACASFSENRQCSGFWYRICLKAGYLGTSTVVASLVETASITPEPLKESVFTVLFQQWLKIFVFTVYQLYFLNFDQAPFRHIKGKPGRGMQSSSSGKGKGNTKLKGCKIERKGKVHL